MRYLLGLIVVLAAFWLVLSGHYKPLWLVFGASSVALVVWLAHRMDVLDREATPVHLTFRLPGYWLWLSWQVLLSATSLTLRVLRGPSAIKPSIRRFPHGQRSPVGETTLANSITLTPGTLSVRVDDDCIEVHSLHSDLLDQLENGDMRARVRRLDLGRQAGGETAADGGH